MTTGAFDMKPPNRSALLLLSTPLPIQLSVAAKPVGEATFTNKREFARFTFRWRSAVRLRGTILLRCLNFCRELLGLVVSPDGFEPSTL